MICCLRVRFQQMWFQIWTQKCVNCYRQFCIEFLTLKKNFLWEYISMFFIYLIIVLYVVSYHPLLYIIIPRQDQTKSKLLHNLAHKYFSTAFCCLPTESAIYIHTTIYISCLNLISNGQFIYGCRELLWKAFVCIRIQKLYKSSHLEMRAGCFILLIYIVYHYFNFIQQRL